MGQLDLHQNTNAPGISRTNGRTSSSWLIAAIAAAALLALSLATTTPAEEITKTYTISGRARVHIETDDGSVRVSTGDIKQVEIRVDYSGYKLDQNLTVNSSQSGDSVDISVKTHGSLWSWGVHHTSLRVEVHMPREADLSVRSGDGSIEVDSINGNVDLTAGDGHITAQGLRGSSHLHTGDGHIEARGLDGQVDASSGDGHVNLEGRFDSLRIRTGDGSVTARANSGSHVNAPWDIHTGDGSVDLEIPGDLQANIEASTHDGHISLGLPVTVEGTFSSSRIQGKLNGGGQPLTIHTGDGSIHLNKT
jgi:Putative adhesin